MAIQSKTDIVSKKCCNTQNVRETIRINLQKRQFISFLSIQNVYPPYDDLRLKHIVQTQRTELPQESSAIVCRNKEENDTSKRTIRQ